ncbi:MAG: GNAT family protein [Chloroflexota bacterium]
MIVGDRIRLRAIEREDLPRFVSWLNDPEVRAGLSLYLPLSLAEEEKWFEGMLEKTPDERALIIEIRNADQWIPIGNGGIFGINHRNRSAELGIFIGEKTYWNQGYGSEAVSLLLQHGFATLNLNRIALRVFETNPRAIRAYEKVGFILEGRFRQAEFRNGRYIDVLYMSVLREEWLKVNQEPPPSNKQSQTTS